MKFYERVISDFGGYEKCKDILSQPNIDFIMNAQALREHMLEYRRQHNIFEVGDLVVNDAFINSHVYVFKKLLPDISMALIAYDDDEGACGLYSLRHATDEEVKAGKRLEVNS